MTSTQVGASKYLLEIELIDEDDSTDFCSGDFLNFFETFDALDLLLLPDILSRKAHNSGMNYSDNHGFGDEKNSWMEDLVYHCLNVRIKEKTGKKKMGKMPLR